MNKALVEEAASQLNWEKEYIDAHGLIKCRCETFDEETHTGDCVKVRLVLEAVGKMSSLLQEGLNAPNPKPKKFWQFWK